MNLKNDRIISSIPRENAIKIENENGKESGGSKCSYNPEIDNSSSCPIINDHDPLKQHYNWVYPSPKMFWDAMKRKGTLPIHLKDSQDGRTHEELDWIVTIHNVVNEQCWQEICKWERFRIEGCNSIPINKLISQNGSSLDNSSPIRLQRFLGRPDDLSPRAWFKSTILGYRKPFDRHDWYISEGTDRPPRRYVIDFYAGGTGGDKSKSALTAFYLDVRPALDSVELVKLRIKKYLCETLKDKIEYFNKYN